MKIGKISIKVEMMMYTLIIFQIKKRDLPVPSAQSSMSEAELDQYCRRHLVNHNLMVGYLPALIHCHTIAIDSHH